MMTEASVGVSPYRLLSDHDAVLAALESFDEPHAAAAAQRARAMAPPEVARAALATVFARRRAKASGKFDRPDLMLFTREGYEQATSSAVARHRSERFTGLAHAADLCCGIGSDAVALAGAVDRVFAVDVDLDALACAEHNASTLGASKRIRFACADAATVPLGDAQAVFADPSRRRGTLRSREGDSYSPPLNSILARAREVPGGRLCVKAAPGLDVASPVVSRALGDLPLEVEIVSERGVCKEATLWCGEFARGDGARRATVIDRDGTHVFDGDPRVSSVVSPLAGFIGEPDPSVIRAGLIGALCDGANALVLDPRVAYLTASATPARSPFVRWFRVREAMPFGVKRLRAYLRDRGVGHAIVKTRAFPLRPEDVNALLKLRGERSAVIVCTTIGTKKTAIVCDPM